MPGMQNHKRTRPSYIGWSDKMLRKLEKYVIKDKCFYLKLVNDSFEGLYSLADDISFGERTIIAAEENFQVRVTDEV